MKQNLKLKNYSSPIALLLVVLLFTLPACVTRSRSDSPTLQSRSEIPTDRHASLININTATPAELEKLPGIGKVIAERIVAQREQFGPFRRAEHLMLVRGISDHKFREIQSMIVAE